MADISPTTTTATFAATEVPNARAKVWKETFTKFASTADVLTPLEGPEGSGASIAVRNDIKGRRGDRIEFTASSELGEFGVLGENTLKGNEEDLKFSGTTCVLEFKRHATAITQSLKKKWLEVTLLSHWLLKFLVTTLVSGSREMLFVD